MAKSAAEEYDFELHSRLKEWAYWYNQDNPGFPKESLIVKVMIMGVLIRSSIPLQPPNNERAEEVNFWIKRLEQIYPLYAKAIRDCYNNPHMSDRQIAHANKISVSTLKSRVHTGKVWLSGWLCGRICGVTA